MLNQPIVVILDGGWELEYEVLIVRSASFSVVILAIPAGGKLCFGRFVPPYPCGASACVPYPGPLFREEAAG